MPQIHLLPGTNLIKKQLSSLIYGIVIVSILCMMSYTNFCTALKVRPMIESTIMALTPAGDCMAKPQDSLTAPIRDHSAQLSLKILDFFDAIA